MLDAQRPYAEWMLAMMAKHRINARPWAEAAGLGKDTVSRAVKEGYSSVTKIGTLIKLAEQVGERPPGAAAAIPTCATLAAILDELTAPLVPSGRLGSELLEALAAGLRDTLLYLADEPEAQTDPKAAKLLARVAVRKRGQQDDEP